MQIPTNPNHCVSEAPQGPFLPPLLVESTTAPQVPARPSHVLSAAPHHPTPPLVVFLKCTPGPLHLLQEARLSSSPVTAGPQPPQCPPPSCLQSRHKGSDSRPFLNTPWPLQPVGLSVLDFLCFDFHILGWDFSSLKSQLRHHVFKALPDHPRLTDHSLPPAPGNTWLLWQHLSRWGSCLSAPLHPPGQGMLPEVGSVTQLIQLFSCCPAYGQHPKGIYGLNKWMHFHISLREVPTR